MPQSKNHKIAIRVFGAFAIEREGKSLDMEKLGYSKPIELLKFLIAYGGHNISTDFVISRLWADSDGDHAKNSFDGTLYRLRNILGCKEALLLNSGVLSINQRICSLDMWEFDALAADIENGLRAGTLEDPVLEARKLLSVIRGPCFWLASDAPWAYTIQEKIKARFLRLVIGLGRTLEKTGEFDEAISLYGTALEHYPLAEEVCLRLVQSRIEQGLFSEALMSFRNFSHVLNESLGLAPSKNLQDLIARIKPVKT